MTEDTELVLVDDDADPAEYLKWAPLMLEAEECHAGNREGFVPRKPKGDNNDDRPS